MTNFIPGKVIKTFVAKNDKQAVIRYPQWQDLDAHMHYINKLSAEDTFITLSGKQLNRKDEANYFADWFKNMELGDKVFLCCFIEEKLVATCSVDRNTRSRDRSKHIASMGIFVAKKFRGSGVGRALVQTTLAEAKKKIKGLKLITLSVYEKNSVAQNLYQKLGFKKVGSIPKGVLYKGKYMDEIKMCLQF